MRSSAHLFDRDIAQKTAFFEMLPDTGKECVLSSATGLAIGSLVVGCAVLGLKFLAYAMTGSVALFSDALESVVNVAAAGAALIAIRISARPPDANHPYGHSKVEYLSSVLEGVLIVIAALLILREAYAAILARHALESTFAGLAVNGVATLVNAMWARRLLRGAHRLRSPALAADGRHLMADVITSVGVIAGVTLAQLTGWILLDPLIAALVAVNVLWSGWVLVRASIGGLMDEAPDPETLERVRGIIADHSGDAIEAHDLRMRRPGHLAFVDFHLVVSAEMSVLRAHAICDRIEAALRRELGDVTVSIHVEPEHKVKGSGSFSF